MRLFERNIDDEINFKIDFKENRSAARKILPSIRSIITPKQRKIFIRKLFFQEETEYEQFIGALEPADNWAEAYRTVEKEFANRKISLNGEEAISFTNILFRRYYDY
jgi:hypothetical protein